MKLDAKSEQKKIAFDHSSNMLRLSSFEADSQLHDDLNNEKCSQETDTLASVDLVLLHHCKIRCRRHQIISM